MIVIHFIGGRKMNKEELDNWHHILLVGIRELAEEIKKSKCWKSEKTIFLIKCKAIETRIEDIIEVLDKGGKSE